MPNTGNLFDDPDYLDTGYAVLGFYYFSRSGLCMGGSSVAACG